MRTSRLQPVIEQLRKAVLVRDGAGLTDGELLTLFIEQRDQAAFEALVKRHGPMVLGVCRAAPPAPALEFPPPVPLPPRRTPLAPQIVLAPGFPEIYEVHTKVVRLSLLVEPGGKEKLSEIALIASADEGETWERVQTVSPEEGSFVFRAPKEGLYWLGVQAVARNGETEPLDQNGTVLPQLKLQVKLGRGHVEQKGRQSKEPSMEDVSKVWVERWKDYEEGSGTQEVLCRVEGRLFQVQLVKAKNREDWITAWQAHVDRLQRIEKTNKDRYEAGRISVQEYQTSIRWRRHAVEGLIRALGQ
jgi:hypothetical protein